MQEKQYKAWFEKYRPRTIDELIFPVVLNGEKKDPNYIKTIFTDFYNNEFIRGNVLSYGPGGFGKTSLNKIMQAKIIKHPNDIFILGRKVEDVDKLLVWLQQSKVKSNQKLVIIEEIDRLSTQAQLVLKDGPLEKYQDKVSFLATTNNPEKLDTALVTRFNLRMHFEELDVNQTIERMKNILSIENIKYNEEALKSFVNNYIKRGLRELISNLEINSVTGEFVFDEKTALNLTGNEDYIVGTVIWMLNYLKTLPKENVIKILNHVDSDQTFAQYYNYIIKLLKEDLLLNYEYIYKEMIQSEKSNILDFGIKSIFIQDYQKIDQVRMRNFWFLNSLSRAMQEVLTLKTLYQA